MENKLSAFQRGKIVLGVIEDLKNLPNKDKIYINNEVYSDNKIYKKIAEKSGITLMGYGFGDEIDITEDISITIEDRIIELDKKLNGRDPYSNFGRREIEFAVSEELKHAVEVFENKHIPLSGTCDTTLGEIFRAIQYIQYRAFNDGDLPWNPGSPTFTSYVYLKYQINQLNRFPYSNDGERFEFKDKFLTKYGGNEISDIIEDHLAQTANFIKYQIMDLLLNNQIEDTKNNFDSRDFRSLNEDRYY